MLKSVQIVIMLVWMKSVRADCELIDVLGRNTRYGTYLFVVTYACAILKSAYEL